MPAPEAEREHHENLPESSFRSLFEHSPYGIFRAQLDPDRFLVVNPALVQMLRYGSAAELCAETLSSSIFAQSSDRAGVVEAIRINGRYEGSLQWKCKDGSPISVHVVAQSVPDPDRGETFIEGTVEDITSRKALELHLQRVQRLESIGGIAAGLAHELNNLHMVISSYAEMLLPELDSADQRRKAESIVSASHRASALIHQLLAFSRKQTLAPRVLNASHALDEIASVLRGVTREDIELVTHWGPELGKIMVDPAQLQEVIMNVAVNARDAMPNGGRLSVSASNLRLNEEKPVGEQGAMIAAGEYVVIEVADTGVGMEKKVQSRIFEPFFTTKPIGEGTGLGLSSAYGIVKQSGGWIAVDSAPGLGSTFTIYLPRVESNAAELSSVQFPLFGDRKPETTILLVEDEAGLREPVRDFLGKQGYRVIEACNGVEAIKAVDAHSGTIDALLTDVVMPQMNGPELAMSLKKRFPHLKILFMSGYTEHKLGDALQQSELLQKPFPLRALKTKLQEILATVVAQ